MHEPNEVLFIKPNLPQMTNFTTRRTNFAFEKFIYHVDEVDTSWMMFNSKSTPTPRRRTRLSRIEKCLNAPLKAVKLILRDEILNIVHIKPTCDRVGSEKPSFYH